jgi:hypothetical protein
MRSKRATVLRAQGYAVVADPERPTQEWDTLTCAHCSRVVFVQRDPGGFCRVCMKNICGPCADRGRCDPYEKKLERAERQAALWRAME